MTGFDIDTKITELFNVVRRQQQEVEAAEKESKQSWKTNCSFQIEGTTIPINIQTATEAQLKGVVIILMQHVDYMPRAETLLGLKVSDKIDGYSYTDWLADCKKRVTVMGLRAKKTNLEALEKRLNAIISPEQKRQMELDAIAASLETT